MTLLWLFIENCFGKWEKYLVQILGFYYQIFIDWTLLQQLYFCITFRFFHSILLSKMSFWLQNGFNLKRGNKLGFNFKTRLLAYEFKISGIYFGATIIYLKFNLNWVHIGFQIKLLVFGHELASNSILSHFGDE